jgi:uncharacterized membrane protein
MLVPSSTAVDALLVMADPDLRHTRSVMSSKPDRPARKPILVPLGIVLILIGLVVPIALTRTAQDMQPSTLQSVCSLLVGLFRACFFAGIAFLVFGLQRNRKSKKATT